MDITTIPTSVLLKELRRRTDEQEGAEGRLIAQTAASMSDFTLEDLLTAMGRRIEQTTKGQQMAITAQLKRMGYARRFATISGKTCRMWSRAPDDGHDLI